MPEEFDTNKIKNEYFVVPSEALRQLPEIYGGRYGGRYGEPVGATVNRWAAKWVKISENSWRISNETTDHLK